MSKCTKCNKELASDHRGKKCDNCKNRIFERIRQIGAGIAGIGTAALFAAYIAVASRPAEDEGQDDEDDF